MDNRIVALKEEINKLKAERFYASKREEEAALNIQSLIKQQAELDALVDRLEAQLEKWTHDPQEN